MPGTAIFLGSNLTRTCYVFQTGNILFQIKTICLLICRRLSCHILESCFLLRVFFVNVAFFVLLTPTICYFTYLDFVFPSLFFFVSPKLFRPIFLIGSMT